MSKKQVTGYDFTLRKIKSDNSSYTHTDVAHLLQPLCKLFVFQEEKSQTGYEHYQGRLRLFKKNILSSLLKLFPKEILLADLPSFTPTVSDVYQDSNFNYVLKADTRVLGPWKNADFVHKDLEIDVYVPKQYNIVYDLFYPYQKEIYDTATKYEPRNINVLVDTHGNLGKSTIANICCIKQNGVIIPNIDDSEKIIYSVCDILMAKKQRSTIPIFIDLPRANQGIKMTSFYSAIETIKSGRLYDVRNRYKEWYIDTPMIWVFTNSIPDMKLLSRDRWQFYTVDDNKNLVKYHYVETTENE